MKLRHIENNVIELLNLEPEARDDDNLLLALYVKEHKQINADNLIIEERLATLFNSVTRARRKVQEKNPDLRGERWKDRQAAQADFIEYALDLTKG
jgi:hypothetical protein